MLAYSLLAGALYSRHHKDYLVSPPSFYNIMSDLHSRTPNVGPAKQRRTRRAQPYPSSSSSALYHEVREPGASNLDTPTIEPSSALSSPAANSSRTSSDAASSPNDGLCGPAPPNPTTILQRGSACLTCRRRKLKCDAIKPACTSQGPGFRSKNQEYGGHSTVTLGRYVIVAGSANAHAWESPPLDTGSMSSLRVSSPNHNSDIWKPLDSGQNELINLAASLAVTDSTSLESQRGQIVDTSRRMTPWWELDEIPTGIQEHLISTFLARRWEVRDGVQISGMDIDSVLPPFLGSPALSLTFHDCGRLFLKSRHINLTRDKSFEDLQPIFVSRVRKELEAALVGGDRLIDFIHSERWCPQPEHGSIDATRDPVQSRGEDMVPGINGELHMLPRPRDNIERNEYIHAFWGVYMQDIGGLPRTTTAALVTGLPSSVADSEITTPWPVHLDQVIPLNHQPGQTIASFYCGLAGTANMSQDRHSQTIRIKKHVSFRRGQYGCRLAFESVRYPELGLWAKHDACDKAITEASRSFPAGLEHIGPEGSLILASRATLLAAQIRLHACLAATRPESREKCLAAAAESMALILRLRYVMIPTGVLLLLGLDWTVVKSFYVAEQSRLLKEGNYLAAEAIGKNVEEIGSELESVPAKYPGLEL
ncbi:GAL4-like Zn(II)2Cys6 (or C6 zinc) binuclear cluster DNA-binding domain [Rhizoctonia solani]|uniref:GAL4-like Zn(II)2Cys6 (Or C6 zinc) binuclear cluster DNA-binding domain n=1 Tax=Rhizoctonia solani TaxID=456999 RepID=A0A8H7M7M0_9AGAM|nr:GAL4-like Zn(II)2Cys6 (or C6 zinc) binuclear cluster DNA-binding domain [Rhizoctonia solani]